MSYGTASWFETTVFGEPTSKKLTPSRCCRRRTRIFPSSLYPKHSAVFAFRVVSPVRSSANRGALSTMLVQSVALSQPRELSCFSVDTSEFVDRPVERGAPDWMLSNSGALRRERKLVSTALIVDSHRMEENSAASLSAVLECGTLLPRRTPKDDSMRHLHPPVGEFIR